jgi:drug/metabolite transporter (DMT)-like permease
MINLLLYGLTVSIWGSTWLVITFQLGTPVAVAVGWRFTLAAAILWGWCLARGNRFDFNPRQIALAVLQGLMNYCFNYWMVYQAESRISSGLVAVLFSLLMVFNMIGGRLFFVQRINAYGAAGAALGVAGVLLVFWPEVTGLGGISWGGDARFLGICFALGATLFSSCGNLLSVQTQKSGVPLIPGMAIGMAAGGLTMVAIGLASGDSLAIPATAHFLLPLLYLSLFGSVIAFAAYLGLIQRIGAAQASYANVLIPMVALALSSLFEGYQWRIASVAGLMVSLAGNLLVMRGKVKAAS